MRFNLYFDGELEIKNACFNQLLDWLSEFHHDLPYDVFVDISIKQGVEL